MGYNIGWWSINFIERSMLEYNPIPTILNNENKTSDGTGVSSFVSAVTGLLPATTYYIRAYAVNSVGTAYGNEITFSTLTANP